MPVYAPKQNFMPMPKILVQLVFILINILFFIQTHYLLYLMLRLNKNPLWSAILFFNHSKSELFCSNACFKTFEIRTIRKPNFWVRFRMAFEIRTIHQLNYLRPFEFRTRSVFEPPLYCLRSSYPFKQRQFVRQLDALDTSYLA